jgi:hypothetical protein
MADRLDSVVDQPPAVAVPAYQIAITERLWHVAFTDIRPE